VVDSHVQAVSATMTDARPSGAINNLERSMRVIAEKRF